MPYKSNVHWSNDLMNDEKAWHTMVNQLAHPSNQRTNKLNASAGLLQVVAHRRTSSKSKISRGHEGPPEQWTWSIDINCTLLKWSLEQSPLSSRLPLVYVQLPFQLQGNLFWKPTKWVKRSEISGERKSPIAVGPQGFAFRMKNSPCWDLTENSMSGPWPAAFIVGTPLLRHSKNKLLHYMGRF